MSMIGCFYALSDDDLEAVIQVPARMHQLDGSQPPPPAGPSFFARLFGAKSATAPVAASVWTPSSTVHDFCVDKAWQGIHFLLTGSDWEGTGPLAFILRGGREIAVDMGYGSPHGFTAAEVKEIDAALRGVDAAALYDRADPAEFAKSGIYPTIWMTEPKESCIGYVIEYYKALQTFVAESAKSNSALIAYIS